MTAAARIQAENLAATIHNVRMAAQDLGQDAVPITVNELAQWEAIAEAVVQGLFHTTREYAAARHAPRRGEHQCDDTHPLYTRDRCAWVKGHPGPHNTGHGGRDLMWGG